MFTNTSVATVWDLRSLADEIQKPGYYDVCVKSHEEGAIGDYGVSRREKERR